LKTNILSFLAVGSGGFLGAMLRFYVGLIVVKRFPHDIPFATLSVNIVGSFLMGSLVGLFLVFVPSNFLKLFLLTGFLGALTTYSTFAIESFFLLNNSLIYGIINIILNLVGSILAATIGYKIFSYFGHI